MERRIVVDHGLCVVHGLLKDPCQRIMRGARTVKEDISLSNMWRGASAE